MRRLTKLSLLALALVIPAGAASANDYYGFNNAYFSIKGGYTWTNDSDYSETGVSGDIEFDDTYNASAAFGGRWLGNMRTELEVSYRDADVENISAGGGSASADGNLETWAFLINGYYDFNPWGRFTPYIGAGIGAAHHRADVDAVGGLGVTGGDDSDTVFAYSATAGAATAIAEQTDLTVDYRYLGSSDPDFGGFETDYDAHEVRVGLKFGF